MRFHKIIVTRIGINKNFTSNKPPAAAAAAPCNWCTLALPWDKEAHLCDCSRHNALFFPDNCLLCEGQSGWLHRCMHAHRNRSGLRTAQPLHHTTQQDVVAQHTLGRSARVWTNEVGLPVSRVLDYHRYSWGYEGLLLPYGFCFILAKRSRVFYRRTLTKSK